jgi:hypothetical protein
MFKRKLFMMALVLALAASLLVVGTASAHNAACVLLPDGRYVLLGSWKNGPEVSASNPHYHTATIKDYGRLDLVEGPGDQYGVRFAADQNVRILRPDECPAP